MALAHRLFKLYPESTKTEELTASIVALFLRYPLGALVQLFDAKNGIHCMNTFMPKAAELRAFLTPLENKLYADAERERREAQAKLPAPEINRTGRPTMQEMKDKHGGEHWGLDSVAQIKREEEEEKQDLLRFITRAGKQVFDLECDEAGANRDSLVSPSLAKLLTKPRE